MRNYSLWLGLLGALFWVSPAAAAELLVWQLQATHQRLVLTAPADRESAVPPEVLLRAEADQLILDLPATELAALESANASEGAIARVEAQQLSPDFARLAIALRSGYEIAPEDVEWQALSANQWAVQLPVSASESSSALPAAEPIAQATPSEQPDETGAIADAAASRDFQIASRGFFVHLAEQENSQVAIVPSRDGRSLELELTGATLPASLQAAQTLAVNRYGVRQATFNQLSTNPPRARIVLDLTGENPDWNASVSDRGLAIVSTAAALQAPSVTLPTEATLPTEPALSKPTVSDPPSLADERGRLAEIESAQISIGNQLLVVADRPLSRATSRRSRNGVYYITIPNARLAEDFEGPQLRANSPVSQLNVRQQDQRTVVLVVQTADGIEVGAVRQPRRHLVALQFRRQQATRPLPPRRPVNPTTRPPTRRPTGPLPRITNSRVLVTIDPGHGGRDPGAIGIGGLREKDVVLPISREVASILQRQGVRVQMTRVDDRYVTLAGRAQMANRARAQIFVSIHANAISLSRPDVNGVETYYYSSGRQLAQAIQGSILRSISIGNRGVKRARFYVLRYTAMPSALVEVGFVTGRYDAPRLRNSAFRSQMAEAIARGILEYIQWRRL